MKVWRLGGAVLLIALAAQPCSMSFPRKLWSKKPGSESRLFAFERNGRVGFIDPVGNVVVKPTIEAAIEDVGDFSNGLARIGHQGFVDETGRWVIKQDSLWAYDFSDGVARIAMRDSNQQYGHVGLLLDVTGNVVAKVSALETGEFSEGLAFFESEGKPGVRKLDPGNFVYRDYPGLKGFLDRTGHVVIPPAFAQLGPFTNGLARAVLDGYCHVAMPDGTKQGSPTSGYPTDCGGAPADAVSPCKVGFIDPKGSFAIQPDFEAAQDFQEKLAAARMGGVWGFIDTNGTTVIPARFEQVQSFREGLAAVRIGSKWGFIDQTGRLAVPAMFDRVEAFSDSLALVYLGQRFSYIDRNGRTKINGAFREGTSFVQGLAAVLLTEKHVAYIDHSGKTIFDYFRK